MDRYVPRRPSRRTVVGAGVTGALTLGALGTLPGLSGTARSAAGTRGGGAVLEPTDFGAYVSFTPGRGAFALVGKGRAVPLLVSDEDYAGVRRAVGDLRDDIERVTKVRPALVKHAGGAESAGHGKTPKGSGATAREVAIIGTIGHSPLIDDLIAAGKLDVGAIEGRWETSLHTVVEAPMDGVDRAFVIAGSDQRGTIFGSYDVSLGIGVSPWYWWDDVAPVHRDALYIRPGRYTQGTPVVKYRGIFINDENPALGTWAPAYFGPGKAEGHEAGFNADFYAKVFELLLRLKANYLWPAVWGRAFAEDDPENHARATAYGIVMGTSHEAPMMRGIEEWNRHAVAAKRDTGGAIVTPGHDPYGGTGEWSFRNNAEAIKAYWRDGIQRMVDQGFEGVVTLGMRGNGDTSLPDGDGIELMREIIDTQRTILAEVTGKDVTTVPQVWTLYKEVQRYWDRGLRAPDDVTVVLTDDNWANIRMHPDPAEPDRAGGYGLYYHFDYVGAGRNYKWVDTTSVPNMWDQLRQAVAYGNHGLWVVNVGDLKGNERPTQFFLDYAFSPQRWGVEDIPEWEERFARQNFGPAHAAVIADVLAEYAQLQSRRKPELLNRRISLNPAKDPATDASAVVNDDQASPFSLTAHQELERVTEEWRRLALRAEGAARRLPEDAQDAWFELVGYAVQATANLYALREAEFTNLLYAAQGRAATNDRATTAEARLQDDFALNEQFNTKTADGKWAGFMTQPHIDYGDVARYGPNASWQQPELNGVALPDVLFPAVKRIELPEGAELGVAIDGCADWWPKAQTPPRLPTLSPYQTRPAPYIEVFNRGSEPFAYRIEPSVPWIRVSRAEGTVRQQIRAVVSVDWKKAPEGSTDADIVVHGPGGATVTVKVTAERPSAHGLKGFVEAGGYLAIDAEHATRTVGAGGITWQRIDRIGRSTAGLTPVPVTAAQQTPGDSSPRLEYEVSVLTPGEVTVWAYLSPRNPALARDGLKYAISFDDDAPQTVDVIAVTGANDGTMNSQWARNTSDNVNRTATRHTVTRVGVHRLKFWMVDPTVVLQRLVVDTGGLEPTYLGPPESHRLP